MKSVPQVGNTGDSSPTASSAPAGESIRSNVLALDARLTARLFGPPALTFRGEDVGSRLGAKQRALLFLLLLAESHRMPRSVLAAMLWTEQGDGASRANLRLALSRLRQQLPGLVQADKESVWMKTGDVARVDALQVDAAARRIKHASVAQIRVALEDASGEFLAGFSVRGAPEFDNWLRQMREHYAVQSMTLVRAALDQLDPQTDHDAVLWFSQRWVQQDDTDEAANRQMMLAYQAMGRRTHAIRQYERYRELLAERLGARPSAAIYELYRKIHSDAPRKQPLLNITESQHGAEPDNMAPTRLLSVSGAGDLPRIGTPMVGRDRLLVELVRRFSNPACRLLTLLGPGGIGKSRLAIEFANGLAEPVTFVSLTGVTPVSDPQEAGDALTMLLAASLGITIKSPEPSQRVLLRQLSDRTGVLLLDGFEVLIPAAPVLEEILRAAPGMRILVTSRERLLVPSEWLLDVPGLSVNSTRIDAPGDSHDSLSWTDTADAALLFESVAQRVQPDFDLRDHWPSVERILHFVQGSPLGIELAANWVSTLSCEEIVSHLEQGLDLLARDACDGMSRHASMRAVLESSWQLLDDNARNGLTGLSIFGGSVDATAAEQVCNITARDLAMLVDRSWLTAIRMPCATHFLMHDLVRHFVSEKLHAQPDSLESVSERHADYFKRCIEQTWTGEQPPDAQQSARFDPGRHNLDQAWHWLRERRGTSELFDFIEGCHQYYVHKGWMRAAVLLLEQALTLPDLGKTRQIRWQNKLAQDQWHSSRQGRSRFRAEKVLELVGETVPRGRGPAAMALLGSVLRHGRDLLWRPQRMNDSPWAEDLVQALVRMVSIGYLATDNPSRLLHFTLRSAELSARQNVPSGCAWSNAFLSIMANSRGWPRASNFYASRALQVLPDLGKGPLDSFAYLTMGIDRFIAGQWETAVDLLERSAGCYEATGQWRITMDAAAIKGLLLVNRRQHEASAVCWEQLKTEGKAYGDRLVELWGYIGAAEADLVGGVRPDTEALAAAAAFLPAGTRHEQCRFDAATAGAALLDQDYELASHHAHKALITLQSSRYLPFYDAEAIFHCTNVLLHLAERSPLQQTIRDSAVQAARLAYRFGSQNPFFMPRAALLYARALGHSGQGAKAQKLAARSRMTAHALGLPVEAEQAARFTVRF